MAVTISGTSGINQDNIGTAPIKSFTSTNQSIPTATSQAFTVAHGLGVTPRIFHVVAVCLTANNGWAVGDETDFMTNAVDNGNQQTRPYANSTVVGYFSGSGIIILNRTNQYGLNLINNTNWAIKVYAFA
jgi:hypothetical protein